jgi:hypothetical protein
MREEREKENSDDSDKKKNTLPHASILQTITKER